MGSKKSRFSKMKGHRITMHGTLESELRGWLTSHPLNHERGAIILFRRFSRIIKGLPQSDRYIAVEIIKMEDDWIIESSETHFKINMRKFPEIYFRCETENLELGFVHSHPTNYPEFSSQDEINEKNILHGLAGCNGLSSVLISMILVEGKWFARAREGKNPENVVKIRHISVLSDKIELYGLETLDESPESLKRQEAAFGAPFNAKLQSLRVAVIGLGGTGSPIATLLARTGVGELILIDGDNLDVTNMNRVRGYIGEDVGHKKAQTLTEFINSLKLKVLVTNIPSYLNDSPEAIDALSSADVIFGCTDDIAGRDLLNQALYYYSLVYIDSGLSGNVDVDIDGNPCLRSQKGRVSCILPEYGACLRCQKVITDEKLYAEQRLKENPELAELDPEVLEKDYYIFGAGVKSPGIGAFTSGTADNAVATFMNLISGFRKLPSDLRQDNIWIDFINMCIHSNEPKNNPECIYCRKHMFSLKSEGKYRLGISQLGKL